MLDVIMEEGFFVLHRPLHIEGVHIVKDVVGVHTVARSFLW